MFQERLRQARLARGYTQRDLAVMMQVSRETISQWEHGVTHPTFDRLNGLAALLEISLDALCGPEGPPTPNRPSPTVSDAPRGN